MHLNTHFRFTIEYHNTRDLKYRIVGVLVDPESRQVNLDSAAEQIGCYDSNAAPVSIENSRSLPQAFDAVFTYSVQWVPSDVKWASRWDPYVLRKYTNLHWFTLIKIAVISSVLLVTVDAVLVSILRNDIARYNTVSLGTADTPSQRGWKLVSGDVFRTPPHPMLLSVFLGAGAQLLAMVGVLLVFTLFGFLFPANRGSLQTVMVTLCSSLAIVSGYVSMRAYKTFDGDCWRMNLILSPILVPGIVFVVILVLNLLLVSTSSSGAVPFGSLLILIFIWFAISLPLSIGGGLGGLKKGSISVPVHINQIPSAIPQQRRLLRPLASTLLGGVLPFIIISSELYFITRSTWSHRIYSMFGFLFLCVGLAILSATSVTIIMVYFMLCSQNHRWVWQSYFVTGSCAFFVFGYGIIKPLGSLLKSSFVSVCLYMGYLLLVSFLMFMLLGSVGFVATSTVQSRSISRITRH